MALTTVEELLRTAMLADSNISTALGTRWYIEPLPQNTAFPAVTVVRVATVRQPMRNGNSSQTADVGWTRLQIDIWDNTDAASAQRVSQLAKNVIDVLKTFSAYGQGAVTLAGSNRVLNQQLRPVPELQPPGYRAILDVKIWFADKDQ